MDESSANWLTKLKSAGASQNEALADLRELLVSRLHKTFQGRTGVDDSLLDDVAQESLLKTLEHLNQFQGTSHFTTWATAIAVRVTVTELRRRHWKDVSLDQLMSDPRSAGGLIAVERALPPDTEAERRTLVEELLRLIETELTEKQRTALLAELKGMPLEEIGRRMGSNRNAIYKLTHDARKRLRRSLESAGYSVADLQTV